MAITQDELQNIVSAVLSAIRTNSKTIEQLTPVTMLSDNDSFEITGGKRVRYETLRRLIMTLTSAENGSLEELINDTYDLVNEIISTAGQPDGVALLDSSGLIPSRFLPGYVDDVVDFDYVQNTADFPLFKGFYSEIPDEYVDYSFDEGTHHLSVILDSGVYYDENIGAFYIGKIIYAYSGHSAVGSFVLLDDVDTSGYGNPNDDELIVPVPGKIYINKSNNNQYRWSGSQLTMLSVPVAIGNGIDDAFSGYEGAKLKENVTSLSLSVSDLKYPMMEMMNGFTTFNVTSYADDDTPMELEEALDFLPSEDARLFALWPNLGAEIKFLSNDGWKRYQYTQQFDISDLDSCLDPDSWELVVTGSSGGLSGGCDPHCADHSTKIANLTTKVNSALASASEAVTTANDAATAANTANTTANTAKTTANTAKALANAANASISGTNEIVTSQGEAINSLETRINALESAGGEAEAIIFKDLKATADDCGWIKGAYNKDGLTYCYPGANAWLNLRCVPNATTDTLITLPESGMTVGSIIRILDPRFLTTTEAQSAKKVKITPWSSSSKIYGAPKSNSNYWIELTGGYVELIILPGNSESNWKYNFAVRSLNKN